METTPTGGGGMMLQLPRDCRHWPEYRRLERAFAVGGPAEAARLLLWLWVVLGYEVEASPRPGLLSRASLGDELSAEDVAALCTAGLLVEAPEGWVCPRWAQANSGVNAVPMHRLGAASSKVARASRKLSAQAEQLALAVSAEQWLHPTGRPLTPEEVRRVTVLVHLMDGALGRESRPGVDASWPHSLVTDAMAAVESRTEADLHRLCVWLMEHRHHPVVPATTEQALARLEGLCSAAGLPASAGGES